MHFSNGLIIMLLAFVAWKEKLHNLTGEKIYAVLLAVLLLLSVALSPGNGVAAEKSLSIEDVTNTQGVKGLRATFQLSASREAIWDLLTDYDRFKETFTRIHSLKVLSEDDRGARVHFKAKILFLSFEYTLQRDYERPYELLTWHRTAGDFRQVSGSWEILPGPGEGIHVVVFESFVDVGYLIPTEMVRDQAAKELETTVAQMRARLEGG
jgi:ribosome-associated toxin RatA of RatAB toxin-antitoxin module